MDIIDSNIMVNKLIEVNSAVANIRDIDILLETILTKAREISKADAGSIYKREKSNLHFRIAQNDTLQKNLPKGKKLTYSTFSLDIDNSTIAGYVANTGKILKIDDVYNIPNSLPYHFGKKFDELSNYITKSMLTIPLKTIHGHTVGVLQIIKMLTIIIFTIKQMNLLLLMILLCLLLNFLLTAQR